MALTEIGSGFSSVYGLSGAGTVNDVNSNWSLPLRSEVINSVSIGYVGAYNSGNGAIIRDHTSGGGTWVGYFTNQFQIKSGSGSVLYGATGRTAGKVYASLMSLSPNASNLFVDGIQDIAGGVGGSVAINSGGWDLMKNGSNAGQISSCDSFLFCIWNRPLSNAEARSFTLNPWQIFAANQPVFFVPTASGITGTLATTNANDSVAASGVTTVAAVLASINSNDSIIATGNTTVTASLAVTNANDSVAASDSTTVIATLATTNGNDSVSAAGSTTVTGALNKTAISDAVVATGNTTVTATLAATNGNDSVSASNTVPGTSTGILGNSMPASWRPFNNSSPWNTPIPGQLGTPGSVTLFSSANHLGAYPLFSGTTLRDSDNFLAYFLTIENNVRFVNAFTPSIWVVDATLMPLWSVQRTMHLSPNGGVDDWVVANPSATAIAAGYPSIAPNVPLTKAMWGENTADGHMIIIDPALNVLWEMSHFGWHMVDGIEQPCCSTFNIWDLVGTTGIAHGSLVNKPPLTMMNNGSAVQINYNQYDSGRGTAVVEPTKQWTARGGRGGGTPVIAGLIRPEEILAGAINHAIAFTVNDIRQGWLSTTTTDYKIFDANICCRSDGTAMGTNRDTSEQYPFYGMRMQLDPTLTDADFDAWRLTRECRVVARALQNYGMILIDSGGDFAMAVQLLDHDPQIHLDTWERRAPMLYKSSSNILLGSADFLTKYMRVIDMGVNLVHYTQ